MLLRVLGSRMVVSIAFLVVVAVAATAAVYLSRPHPVMRDYCADMPDTIGLYDGSAVTILGVTVGHVTGIHPNGATARVDFDLPADRRLPADVGATTLSDTIVADRRLAVVGADTTAGPWPSDRCITKTLTPKSLSETFSALSALADELNGAGDPAHPDTVQQGLTALDAATAGRGEQINTILKRLGTALNAPDAAIGHLGDLIDAVSSLASSAATYWPQIKDMLTRLAGVLDEIDNAAIPPVLVFMDKLADIMPALNNITVTFGGPLMRSLDSVTDLPTLIQAGVAGLRDLIGMLPPLANAFTTATAGGSKALTIAYTPPHAAVPAATAMQVCSAINAITPRACADADHGLTDLPLSQLVLGSVHAQ